MRLKDYTTEELREELKKRDAKKSKKVCRMCRHWGNTESGQNYYFGDKRVSLPCRFFTWKNGKHYRMQRPSQKACEHFERERTPIEIRAYEYACRTDSAAPCFCEREKGYKVGALEQKAIDIDFASQWLASRKALTYTDLNEFRKAMEE